jgi:glycosidase
LAWALKRHAGYCRRFAPLTFVGNHDVTRIASRLDDPDLVGHAVCALLTLPGIPSLYAGDEWGLTGVKENRAGGDDAVRPEFPSEPPEPARGGPPQRDGPAIARVTRDLLRWRRARPWMATADLSVGPVTNTTLAYSLTAGGRRASVLLNIGSGPHVVEVDGVRHTVEPRSWKLVSAD